MQNAAVRANAMLFMVRPRSGANMTMLVVATGFLLAAIALSVATPIMVPQGRDVCREDSANLDTYVILYTVRVWVAAISGLIIATSWNPAVERTEQSFIVQFVLRMREMLTWFNLGTFIAGNFYMSRASILCAGTPLQRYATGILILQYIELLMPACLVVLGCVAVCFCMPLLLRMLLRAGMVPNAQTPATDNQISQLPEEVYRPGRIAADESGEGASCSIYMTGYEAGEAIRELPCGGRHVFHKACIDNWLRINSNCPVCRANVLGGGGGAGGSAGSNSGGGGRGTGGSLSSQSGPSGSPGPSSSPSTFIPIPSPPGGPSGPPSSTSLLSPSVTFPLQVVTGNDSLSMSLPRPVSSPSDSQTYPSAYSAQGSVRPAAPLSSPPRAGAPAPAPVPLEATAIHVAPRDRGPLAGRDNSRDSFADAPPLVPGPGGGAGGGGSSSRAGASASGPASARSQPSTGAGGSLSSVGTGGSGNSTRPPIGTAEGGTAPGPAPLSRSASGSEDEHAIALSLGVGGAHGHSTSIESRGLLHRPR